MAERNRGDRPIHTEAAHAAPDPATVAAVRRVLAPLFEGYAGPVAVRMANGDLVAGRADADCTVILRDPASLRALVLRRDVMGLAEAHLAGDIDVAGDLTALFDLLDHVAQRPPPAAARLKALAAALRMPARRGSGADARRSRGGVRRNSQKSIAHHYDVGNDFYRLWLDPEMVYSGAYFRDPGQSLAEAQADKLDYLCRKLRLGPGLTLLDIGCGWGALACRAARDFGTRVHAITLSTAQRDLAARRVAAEGLSDLVTVELRDYRALPKDARYDRVVSVGMFEHVGHAHFAAYFETVRRVLKDGGLFLNQAISNDHGWTRTPLTRFLNRYVFPDGELVRISDALGPMERAGFEVLDVEALRRHYALTLRRWLDALEANRRRAIDQVGEATWRVWRLYMAGAAHYFEEGSINLYQVLAAPAKGPLAVPLRRDDLYRDRRPASVARAGGDAASP